MATSPLDKGALKDMNDLPSADVPVYSLRRLGKLGVFLIPGLVILIGAGPYMNFLLPSTSDSVIVYGLRRTEKQESARISQVDDGTMSRETVR